MEVGDTVYWLYYMKIKITQLTLTRQLTGFPN